MDIQKVKLSKLTEAPYNPRVELKPGDAEYEKLKKSLEHFGYVEPIVVNKRNMTVIGGHQRLHVMKDLGMEEAEIVYVDLDENDEKALNVALNKISGEWDAEKLEDLMRDLDLGGYNIEFAGFSREELDTLYSGNIADGKNAEENLPEEYSNTLETLGNEDDPNKILNNMREVKRGDIWAMGEHRLICGDSYDEATYKELVGDNKVAMVFTDPPYNYNGLGNRGFRNDFSSSIDMKFAKLRGDIVNKMDNIDIHNIEYLMTKDIPFVMFCCNCHDVKTYLEMLERNEYKTDIHVLEKLACLNNTSSKIFRQDLEYICVGYKRGLPKMTNEYALYRKYLKVEDNSTKAMEDFILSKVIKCVSGSVQDAKECGLVKIEHPTVKNQKLVIQKLAACTLKGELVVDMFSGSGSTLIACEKLGRVCYLSEWDPQFVNLTIDRWEGFTGKKAIRLKEGSEEAKPIAYIDIESEVEDNV